MLLPKLAILAALLCNAAPARSPTNDDSDFVFPESVVKGREFLLSPLDIARKLNDIQTEDDLFRLFPPSQDPNDGGMIAERFGSSGAGKPPPKKVLKLTLGQCQPELKLMPVADPDPTTFYIPACTRQLRCNGCCNSGGISCQPTQINRTDYLVTVVRASRGSGQSYVHSKKTVTLEDHISCRCLCTIKKEDCTSRQRYDENECACLCKNSREEAWCNEQYPIKRWNSASCTCDCREVRDCSTNFYFNKEHCRCESDRINY